MFLKNRNKIKPIHILLAILPGLIVAGFWGFANPDPKMIIDPSLFGKIVIDPNNSSLGKAMFYGYIEEPGCVYGWIDQDGDGYPAVTSTSGICYDSATPGFVTTIANPTIADCYDLNDEAFPGQEEYFSTTRGTEEQGYDFAENTWNSFDYNCNDELNKGSLCDEYLGSGGQSSCYPTGSCTGGKVNMYTGRALTGGEALCGNNNDKLMTSCTCYGGTPASCEPVIGTYYCFTTMLCKCR